VNVISKKLYIWKVEFVKFSSVHANFPPSMCSHSIDQTVNVFGSIVRHRVTRLALAFKRLRTLMLDEE
jgi:hypothetical protein